MRATHRNQDLLAVAMHIGVAGDSTHWMAGLGRLPVGIEDLARANGHLPFDGSFDLDCGRLGTSLSIDERGPLPPGVGAVVETLAPPSRIDALAATGWIDPATEEVECIVIADADDRVIGAAGFGEPAEGYGRATDDRPGRVWFYGLAPTDESPQVYVRFDGDGVFRPIPAAP